MKKSLLIFLLFINITAFGSDIKVPYKIFQMPTDTTVLPQILALPLQSFIGMPVDSLFSVLPNNYTDRGFKPMGIGYTKGVVQGYGTAELNHCFVEIFIDTFQFMTFPNRTPTTTWNINLAKQETIAFIKVWKNNTCVYGCNNPDYY
jgi:hypothetical protein